MNHIFRFCLILLLSFCLIQTVSAGGKERGFKQSLKDFKIGSAVKWRLSFDKEVNKRTMNVDVYNGVVTVTGTARTAQERDRVTALVAESNDVNQIQNFLVLEPGAEGVEAAKVEETPKVIEGEVATTEKKKVAPKTVRVNQVKPANKAAKPVATANSAASIQVKNLEDATKTAGSEANSAVDENLNVAEKNMSHVDVETDNLAQQAADELRKIREGKASANRE